DSSTVLSFERLRRIAERDNLHVVFAGLGQLAERLRDGGLAADSPPFHIAPDLEAALLWAEAQLLGTAPEARVETVPAAESLAQLLGDKALAEAVSPYLERLEVAAGDRLILQGSEADDIYVIESGSGDVLLETPG